MWGGFLCATAADISLDDEIGGGTKQRGGRSLGMRDEVTSMYQEEGD